MKQFSGISPALIVLLLLLTIAAFILEWIRTPEHPVLAEPPQSTDMAVIGGTTAALLTAYHSAQNGAQVYLFPQGQKIGDDAAFLLADGLAASLTPPQHVLEEPLLPEKLNELLLENGNEMNKPELLAAFIQFSTDLYPLLERINGTPFDKLPDPEKPYLHYSSQPVNPDFFVQQLERKVLRAGVIIRDDNIKELIFSNEKEVRGLLVENNEGETEIIYLRSVVLAQGGYSGDPFSWQPYLPKNNLILPRPKQMGQGLRFAAEMGMDLVQTGFYRRQIMLYSPVNEEYCNFKHHSRENAWFFNNRGELLEWSESSKQEIFNFIHMSPSEAVYLIVNEENIPETCVYFFRRFADWESLARFCGGELPSFPPPFSADAIHLISPVRVGVDYTLGGLAVTSLGEVKQNGKVVKGLYAAGEICGGLHGEAALPGMPLSETLFFSYVAGEAAAEHAWR